MQTYPLFRIQILITGFVLLGAGVAMAQNEAQPTFTPTIYHKVDARSVPAKVTSDDESALTSKGYVRIGTIRAEQPGKKEDTEIIRQLESAILLKAAGAGGDLVRFSKEGAIKASQVENSSHWYNQGHCTSWGPSAVGNTCVMWSMPTRSVKNLISEGTVWRYDPKLAADIAQWEAARKDQDAGTLVSQHTYDEVFQASQDTFKLLGMLVTDKNKNEGTISGTGSYQYAAQRVAYHIHVEALNDKPETRVTMSVEALTPCGWRYQCKPTVMKKECNEKFISTLQRVLAGISRSN
jgi:hypothetical protein